jgi:hypothetical protein
MTCTFVHVLFGILSWDGPWRTGRWTDSICFVMCCVGLYIFVSSGLEDLSALSGPWFISIGIACLRLRRHPLSILVLCVFAIEIALISAYQKKLSALLFQWTLSLIFTLVDLWNSASKWRMNRLRNTAQRPRSDALTNSAPDAANGSPFESSRPNPPTGGNQT